MLTLLLAAHLARAEPIEAVVLLLQGGATCSGAFVDDEGHVATAYHCVAHGGRPQVLTRDGRTAVGRVVAWRSRSDLAVVAVPDLAGEPFLPVREEPPEQGEAVRAMGHPFGVREQSGYLEGTLRWSVSQGIISTVGPRTIQVTAAVNPGSSGGPVIDDQGRLVGVVSRRLSGEGLGFASRADLLPDLLEDPRGLGTLGGTLGASTFLSVWSSPDGTMAWGGRLEASLRDRLVVSAGAGVPLTARWDALRFGQVSWYGGDARLALRQRLLRGQWTVVLDAWGGVSAIPRMAGSVDGDGSVDLSTTTTFHPAVGGRVEIGGSGLDVGAVRRADGWTTQVSLVLGWPGTFWMF